MWGTFLVRPCVEEDAARSVGAACHKRRTGGLRWGRWHVWPSTTPARAVPRGRRGEGSEDADVGGLRALGAGRNVELDLLVLVERAEAAGRDGRVVGEHVGTPTVRGDETESLFRVEPLHDADSHVFAFPGLPSHALYGLYVTLDHPGPRTDNIKSARGNNPSGARKASGNHTATYSAEL